MKRYLNKIFNQDSVLLFLVVALSFWDLGNPDALRQGTEGFYFSITKDMFNNQSFLTPTINSHAHWSKPPLQFWVSYVFYLIKGSSSLLLARLSVAFVSILGLGYISSWLAKFSKIKSSVILIYFLASIGILKYSRILMLEMPLALTTFISILLFYDFLQTQSKRKLILSSFVLGLSILVKGPVSLFMANLAIILFLLTQKPSTKKTWRNFIVWNLIAIFIGSLWYLYSYLHFGREFLNYFFLRENLGKFTSSKTYPISVLFQGLIIFSLPWSLFPIISIKKIYQNKHSFHRHHLFLICSFFAFFIVWFTPAQRSHHYAFPAVFPLLSLILLTLFSHYKTFKKEILITQKALSIFPFLLTVLLIISLFFKVPHLNNFQYLKIILFIIMLSIVCILLWKADSFKSLCLCTVFTLSLFWNFIAPTFFLPRLPSKVVSIIGKREVVTYYRKKSFLEEALQRSIVHKSKDQILSYVTDHKKVSVLIIEKKFFKKNKMEQNYNVLFEWYTWRKRTTFKEIMSSLIQDNLSNLQESNILAASIK